MPASLIRRMVTPAAPEVTTEAWSPGTMPMSLARMERTGPALSGISE
jgi:hypothetical protein